LLFNQIGWNLHSWGVSYPMKFAAICKTFGGPHNDGG